MKVPTNNCPNCGLEIEWNQSNLARPFCSESCKNKDFIAWSNEDHVIADENSDLDVMSEDLSLSN